MYNYYLGYLTKEGKLNKIEIKNVPTTIDGITKMTLNFDNVDHLIDELYKQGFIPRKDIYLTYLIEKGKKGEKVLTQLPSKYNIFTKDKLKYFNSKMIHEYINENKYNLEFMYYLYYSYLLKYGEGKQIADYINVIGQDQEKLVDLLNKFEKLNISDITKKEISIIKKYILETSDINYDKYYDRLDGIIDSITSLPEDLVRIYCNFNKEINKKKIPTLIKLERMFQICAHANEIGIEKMHNDSDMYENIDPYITEFINMIIYKYDAKNHRYITENGKRVIQKREMFDLGTILHGYEKYSMELDAYKAFNQKSVYDELNSEYDEDAEFLEESDFERLGTTSIEEGIQIRTRKRS